MSKSNKLIRFYDRYRGNVSEAMAADLKARTIMGGGCSPNGMPKAN
jgi:hypothetical protein